jgi:mRNA-degrading endonuclease RelE of RelBE toxin-antitoxin system
MSSNSIEIFLTSRFKKDLSQLAKRYRSIRRDHLQVTTHNNSDRL